MLCLDVSRWGRFQDIDLSATYSAECKRHGKQVIYTTLGKPKENDQLHQVYVPFERFRAAQYSRELSDKVLRGCIKIAQQGYWAGGKPPFGFQRLLLDEARKPVQIHKYQLVERSSHVPRSAAPTPVPEWKKLADMNQVLAANDPARLPSKTILYKVNRGTHDD